MTTKELAVQAIDEAFTDGLKAAFMVLHNVLVAGTETREQALRGFGLALENFHRDHEDAAAVIDTHFSR